VEIQRRPWKKYSLIRFMDFLSKATQSARVSQINSLHTSTQEVGSIKNLDSIRLVGLGNIQLMKKIGITISVITLYLITL
jgi:hypothetical protein